MVNNWFLMGSPIPVTTIILSYLLFVLKIGPEFMKKREPFKLHNLLSLYNFLQVIMSGFLFYVCVSLTVRQGLIPRTCLLDTVDNINHITYATYYYLAAKLSELLDTVFFVLRKKQNQVSFLHVYHHSLMVLVTWAALKYEPTYSAVFLGLFNSFVHILMYTYYGLSAIPGLEKYLWWKKYITKLQLAQFVAIFFHFMMINAWSECTPSKIMTTALVINVFLFIYLFGSFYVNTYSKKREQKTLNGNENGLKVKNGKHHQIIEDTYLNEKTTNGDANYKNGNGDITSGYRIKINLNNKSL